MTERNITDLDMIFDLPVEAVADSNLRMMYELIVHRLREESRSVPMNTAQIMLIERMASFYVYMRQKEYEGWRNITPSQQKDMNTFWLAMTAQFQKTLQKATAVEERDRVLYEVGGILKGIFAKIKDKDTRDMLLTEVTREFKEAGIG